MTTQSEIARRTAVTRTADLKVGDRITELGSPEGPFYTVLKVTAKTFVVEAAPEHWLADGESAPMRFRINPNAAVLVAD